MNIIIDKNKKIYNIGSSSSKRLVKKTGFSKAPTDG
jgi:hypothetical protein